MRCIAAGIRDDSGRWWRGCPCRRRLRGCRTTGLRAAANGRQDLGRTGIVSAQRGLPAYYAQLRARYIVRRDVSASAAGFDVFRSPADSRKCRMRSASPSREYFRPNREIPSRPACLRSRPASLGNDPPPRCSRSFHGDLHSDYGESIRVAVIHRAFDRQGELTVTEYWRMTTCS